MTGPQSSAKPGTLWRLLLQARPYWGNVCALFFISLLTSPLALLNPVPLKLVVDCVIGDHDLPAVFRAILPDGIDPKSLAVLSLFAGILVGIALIRHLAELAASQLEVRTAEKLTLDFRTALFRHAQSLSLRFHDSRGAADTAYRIQYDAPAIRWVLVDAFVPLATSVVTLGIMLTVLFRIDSQIAAIALAVMPLLVFSTNFYKVRLKRLWQKAKNLDSSANSVVLEVLGALRVVKAFTAEEREQARFQERAGRTLREKVRLGLLQSGFSMTNGLVVATGTALVLVVAARHVQSGALTLGDLVLVMSYLAMVYGPLQSLANSVASMQGSLASAERVFALFDEVPEVPEHSDPQSLACASGRVEFQDVSFSYAEGRPALRNVSFSIEPGQRVGVSGHTGAGKTTIVSLLLRMYDPTAGRILLDGVDLRDYRLRDLRNQFAIVLQEPVLFSASIAENIAYANPNASREEIVAAAEAAGAHEFISRLDNGYDTPVGERGAQLSGGERQRISLARAFLKNAPILILDEPTSSVDMHTERIIMDGMKRLMAGRTAFMIAHRLSTLDLCDVRLELADGRLAEPAREALASR